MKEKEGIYSKYFELDCCEELSNEICPFHKILAETDLNIKKVHVSYNLSNKVDKHNYIDEVISFDEFKDRLINDKAFLNLFIVILEGEDYEIRQIVSEVWVNSFDKKKTDLIFTSLHA
tara:strand:+ start:910 stop:1263 length:354 start_codon:yes stop_codon:yes gene_type:complete